MEVWNTIIDLNNHLVKQMNLVLFWKIWTIIAIAIALLEFLALLYIFLFYDYTMIFSTKNIAIVEDKNCKPETNQTYDS